MPPSIIVDSDLEIYNILDAAVGEAQTDTRRLQMRLVWMR